MTLIGSELILCIELLKCTYKYFYTITINKSQQGRNKKNRLQSKITKIRKNKMKIFHSSAGYVFWGNDLLSVTLQSHSQHNITFRNDVT